MKGLFESIWNFFLEILFPRIGEIEIIALSYVLFLTAVFHMRVISEMAWGLVQGGELDSLFWLGLLASVLLGFLLSAFRLATTQTAPSRSDQGYLGSLFYLILGILAFLSSVAFLEAKRQPVGYLGIAAMAITYFMLIRSFLVLTVIRVSDRRDLEDLFAKKFHPYQASGIEVFIVIMMSSISFYLHLGQGVPTLVLVSLFYAFSVLSFYHNIRVFFVGKSS